MNSIPYTVYKRCPAVLRFLHRIVELIWKTKSVPEDWALAFVILLAKSEHLDLPAEFRPIAIGNTAGKIFFSVVSDRLQRFTTTNNYIKRNIQKGFLSGVAGCVDHTFMLGEALQERIRDKLAFVVSWID